MPQQLGIELHEDVAARLLNVPSAVTPGERRLTLHWMAKYWDGSGNVFENGTLLGGATRALGMGMVYNENRESDAELHTYDWFSLRQPLDLPLDVWDQLVDANMLTRLDVEEAWKRESFLPLFEELHRNEDYWSFVRPHVAYLPGHEGDASPYGDPSFEMPDKEFGIAFVDGCKSWYGTRDWFLKLSPRLLPGSDIIFQDFGHYTCFWIPMLVATFRRHFELLAYTDMTYVWKLKSVPTEAEVEIDFPPEPMCHDKDVYDEAFDWLLREAHERNDRWAIMVHDAHRAAAYSYIGLKDEAREILDRLLMRYEYMQFRPYLKQARVSPTYTPEGRIEL